MKLLIIGIGYRAGSGKDTVCEMLTEHFKDVLVHKMKFAQSVRAVTGELLDSIDVYEEEFKTHMTPFGLTGGQFLQRIGQGMRDLISPDVWIQCMHRNMYNNISAALSCKKAALVIIIPDVRYQNEADWIASLHGTTICVHRHVAQDSHKSETEGAAIYWQHHINNTGTLENLQTRVDALAPILNSLLQYSEDFVL